MSVPLSPAAVMYGERAAAKLLNGRTGHGGGPAIYRQLRARELEVICAAAFQAGREFERRGGKA